MKATKSKSNDEETINLEDVANQRIGDLVNKADKTLDEMKRDFNKFLDISKQYTIENKTDVKKVIQDVAVSTQTSVDLINISCQYPENTVKTLSVKDDQVDRELFQKETQTERDFSNERTDHELLLKTLQHFAALATKSQQQTNVASQYEVQELHESNQSEDDEPVNNKTGNLEAYLNSISESKEKHHENESEKSISKEESFQIDVQLLQKSVSEEEEATQSSNNKAVQCKLVFQKMPPINIPCSLVVQKILNLEIKPSSRSLSVDDQRNVSYKEISHKLDDKPAVEEREDKTKSEENDLETPCLPQTCQEREEELVSILDRVTNLLKQFSTTELTKVNVNANPFVDSKSTSTKSIQCDDVRKQKTSFLTNSDGSSNTDEKRENKNVRILQIIEDGRNLTEMLGCSSKLMYQNLEAMPINASPSGYDAMVSNKVFSDAPTVLIDNQSTNWENIRSMSTKLSVKSTRKEKSNAVLTQESVDSFDSEEKDEQISKEKMRVMRNFSSVLHGKLKEMSSLSLVDDKLPDEEESEESKNKQTESEKSVSMYSLPMEKQKEEESTLNLRKVNEKKPISRINQDEVIFEKTIAEEENIIDEAENNDEDFDERSTDGDVLNEQGSQEDDVNNEQDTDEENVEKPTVADNSTHSNFVSTTIFYIYFCWKFYSYLTSFLSK